MPACRPRELPRDPHAPASFRAEHVSYGRFSVAVALPHARPLAERLRVESASAHRAVERRVDLDARLGSVEAYTELLAALHPFYRALETALRRTSGWDTLDPPIDLDARRRSHLLAADLRALGRARPLDVGFPCPPLAGLAGALGALYVLEGSTLGGALVARRAARTLDLTPGRGLRFFTAGGAERGERWRAFRRSLAYFAEGPGRSSHDDVVAGALATFAALDAWLEQAT